MATSVLFIKGDSPKSRSEKDYTFEKITTKYNQIHRVRDIIPTIKHTIEKTTTLNKSLSYEITMKPEYEKNFGEKLSPTINIYELENMNEIEDSLISLLEKYNTSYFTISGVASEANIPEDELENIVKNNSKKFRKSFLSGIIQSKGDDIYMLNTTRAFIKDIWDTFGYFNFLKYS
jgi:hypothetical protein